jgi:hypothetical protein
LLIRRMPANWSDMPPAERRAWSLDLAPARGRNWRRRPAVAGEVRPARPVRLVRLVTSLADRDRSVGPTAGRPRKKAAVSPGDLAYEDTWDRVFASIPAVVTTPAPDGESEDDVRLPSVFSKMKNGSSPRAPSMFTLPVDLGIGRPRNRFSGPVADDNQASESTVLS